MSITLTFKTQVLLQALRKLRPLIRKSKYLPILTCIMLEVRGEQVTLSATDLQYAIHVMVDEVPMLSALAYREEKAAIPFDVFFETIKTLSGNTHVILSIEGMLMSITSAGNKAAIRLFNAEEYPIIEGKPAPPQKVKEVKSEKSVNAGVLKAYEFEAVHGRKFSSPQEGIFGEWMSGSWFEILRIELNCVFQLDADDLTPIISKIEAEWAKLPCQAILAYEVVGHFKKQYMKVPLDLEKWKRSTVHSWQAVEEFDYYACLV